MTNIPLKENPSKILGKSRNILLYGAACRGKSACIATLLKNAPENRRLIYVMADRNAPVGFEWGLSHHKVEVKPGQVYYNIPEDDTSSFENLARSFLDFQKKPQKVKHDPSDPSSNKEKYGFMTKLMACMQSFKGTDFVTGEVKNLGDFSKLTTEDIVIFDGLSVITTELWQGIYGDVILYSGYDYGAVQKTLVKILTPLSKMRANVIILAHEKEYTEGEGLQQKLRFVGPDTNVGEANFQILMGLFTDVFRADKYGTKFIWNTKGNDKTFVNVREGIPQNEQLTPDFSLLPCFNDLTSEVK
jgi:hypothetical protein